jgi:pimeloyl-ACP methyl ester carboxylesterase
MSETGRAMTKTTETPHVSTGYTPVNGLNMYYEIHGEGQPLVLLHGAFSAIGTSFQHVLPGLAKTRQVIGLEMQAHGRTADIDRPLSPEQMADDTVPALEHLGIENADFFGYTEHAVEMFRLLGGGVFGDTPAGLPASQLAVLPGTSHVTLVDRADLLLAIIPPFLDAPMS